MRRAREILEKDLGTEGTDVAELIGRARPDVGESTD
jgi:hypothetical protein